MQLGVQLFGCSALYNADPDGLYENLRSIGYSQIEPCVFFGEIDLPFVWKSADLEKHMARAAKYGLTVSSVHAFVPDLTTALPTMIAAAKQYGFTAYVVGVRPPFDRETLAKTATEYEAAAVTLKENGIELWLHNNWAEIDAQIDGVSVYEWMLNHCAHLYAQVDTGWVVYGGGDLAAFFARNEKKIRAIHHKEVLGPIKQEDFVNVPIGQGIVDAALAYRFAKEHDLPQIVDADKAEIDFIGDLKESYDYLNNL